MDLDNTYAYVRRDAVHRATLNAKPDNPESSALMARCSKPQPRQFAQKTDSN